MSAKFVTWSGVHERLPCGCVNQWSCWLMDGKQVNECRACLATWTYQQNDPRLWRIK